MFLFQIGDIGKLSAAKNPMNFTKEIMAPNGFPCKEIICLVTCDPNYAELVDLVSTVKTAVLRADEMSCQSLAIPLQLLPETIMGKNKQAKEIARALKKTPYLKNLEELFVCECSDHPSNGINNTWKRIFGDIERCIDFGPLQEGAVRMTNPLKGLLSRFFLYLNFIVSL